MSPSNTVGHAGRAYRVTWFQRAFAVFFLAFSALFLVQMLRDVISGHDEPELWKIGIDSIVVVSCGFWVAHAFKAGVALFDDAIEVRGLFGKKRLRFDEIRGRREYVVKGEEGSTRYMKLEPNDDRLPTLHFAREYNFDGVFDAWFRGLPDADALDQPKSSNFGLL